jgi:hypothetical protein
MTDVLDGARGVRISPAASPDSWSSFHGLASPSYRRHGRLAGERRLPATLQRPSREQRGLAGTQPRRDGHDQAEIADDCEHSKHGPSKWIFQTVAQFPTSPDVTVDSQRRLSLHGAAVLAMPSEFLTKRRKARTTENCKSGWESRLRSSRDGLS